MRTMLSKILVTVIISRTVIIINAHASHGAVDKATVSGIDHNIEAFNILAECVIQYCDIHANQCITSH